MATPSSSLNAIQVHFQGKVLWVLGYFEALPSYKRFSSSGCDDWVDRLSHVYTVLLLLVCAILVSTAHLVGEAIRCWVPAEFNKDGQSFGTYINNRCWIKNTYNIPLPETIPTDLLQRQDEEITYYQWVPLILLLLAFLYKLPHVIWKILHSSSGMDLKKLCKLAKSTHFTSPQQQGEVVSIIASSIAGWIELRQQYKDTVIVRTKARLSRLFCFYGNKREGTYLTALYLVMKLFYLINVVGQIFLLNAFITNGDGVFAMDWFKAFSSGSHYTESRRFPRVTLCDFKIRQMNNIQSYTVQCVLPINLFNEKLFLFLWFWYCLLALLNIYKMSIWLYLMLGKGKNYEFVKKYLKIGGRKLKASDKQRCKKFAEEYLRGDGCFVLRMLGLNSTDLVVIDVLNELYTQYETTSKTV